MTKGRAAGLFAVAIVAVLLATPLATGQPSVTSPSGASDLLTWDVIACPGQAPGTSPGGQSDDGKLDVCAQVPDVPGGTYHLADVAYLSELVGKTTPTTIANGSTGASPAVSLAVLPSSVVPGQTVTVTGTLRRAYKVKQGSVAFCWGGCPGGLRYDGVAVTWRSATTFTAHITIPDAPWAQTGPDEVVSPLRGAYELGVQCVELIARCGLGPAEGEVAVHLRASARYTCRTVPRCAELHVSPAGAAPGDVVRVSGYAPLVNMFAPGEPVLGLIDGERGGPASGGVTFAAQAQRFGGFTTQVRAGNAVLRVEAAPTWASLGHLAPLSQVQAGEPPLSANPAAPSSVAWCSGGFVDMEGPAGTTKVPTAGATALLLATKQFAGSDRDEFEDCSTVAVDGPAVFVGYAYSPQLYAPAVDTVALYSTDEGATWSFVPVPAGSSLSSFGGFRYGAGGAVDALFTTTNEGTGTTVAVPAVEQYTGGPSPWSEVPYSCPTLGPCITWDAGGAPDCGMNLSFAQVLASTDGGRQWALPPRFLGQVETCWSASVVALSPTEALVVGVDGGAYNYAGVYPMVMTKDSGRTWQLVSLPPLPGQLPGQDQQSLLELPNGAIVATSQAPWQLLAPEATRWCPVATMPAHVADAHGFTVTSGALWWLASSSPGDLAYHVAATSLTCGH